MTMLRTVLLATVVLIVGSAAGWAATVTFHFDSAGIGDPVGDGESGTFTGADGSWTGFTLSTANFGDAVIEFEETAPGTEDWTLRFGALQGQELVPGIYLNAQTAFIKSTQPYIDHGRNGTSCGSGGVGEFEIFDIAYDIFGRVMRLVADFEQACDTNDPVLTGDIDFSTDLTLGATSFTAGNLLVVSRFKEEGISARSLLAEYTAAGSLVQQLPVLRNPGSPLNLELFAGSEGLRDVVVDAMGNIHLFTANESGFDSAPFLSSFDTSSGNWTHRTFSEWDIETNTERYGAVAAFGDYIFSADMDASFTASGVVRWDAAGGFSAQRFASGTSYRDVAAGLDGRLYALQEVNSDVVDVFDPQSLASLGSVTLAHAVLGIAVDARGRIYGVSSNDHVYEFDPSGVELDSLDTMENVFDIDIDRAGRLAVGVEGGFTPAQPKVLLSDVTLTGFTTFLLPDSVSDGFTYVAFVQTPPGSLFSSAGFESGDLSSWSAIEGGLAGFLAVNGTSAESGAFGLEVTVGGSCPAVDDLVITSPPTLEGDFLACDTITASGVQVGGAGARFGAGSAVTIGEGFSVASGAPFEIAFDAGLLSGLAWVGDDSPPAAASYNADFELRLDSLAITPGDLIELFNGYSANGDIQFKVILKRHPALPENRLVLAVRRDDGTYAETPPTEETLLPASWNGLRIRWLTGSGNGSLLVSVDGSAFVGLTGIDNDQQRVDAVRLGYVGGTVTTSTGTLDIDGFSSWL